MSNKFSFENLDRTEYSVGGSKRGEIWASFADLRDLLGEPAFEGKGDKITTEFVVKWTDNSNEDTGTFALYDWHYARNFGNDYEVIQWNIGGHTFNDVLAVDALLEKKDVA